MNVSQEQINDLYSAEVVTQDDENLGGVGQVYLDDQTGEPTWVSVKTGWFGTNESLVPLQGADYADGRIRVAHTKDVIKGAPNVDADQHLSEQEQDELFRYYAGAGVDVSRYDRRDGDVVDRDRDLTDRDREVAGAAGVGAAAGADYDRDRDLDDRDRTDRDLVDRDREDAGSMTLHEERVDVGTEQVETGRVRLRKHVVTEQETVTVPVQREEYEVVREPIADGDRHDGARLGDDEAEVVLHEERPVIEKDVVATERVGLQKETVTDEQQVVTDVSHEEVDVDRDAGYVDGDRRTVTDRDGDLDADGRPRKGDWDGDGVHGEGLDLDGDNRRG